MQTHMEPNRKLRKLKYRQALLLVNAESDISGQHPQQSATARPIPHKSSPMIPALTAEQRHKKRLRCFGCRPDLCAPSGGYVCFVCEVCGGCGWTPQQTMKGHAHNSTSEDMTSLPCLGLTSFPVLNTNHKAVVRWRPRTKSTIIFHHG